MTRQRSTTRKKQQRPKCRKTRSKKGGGQIWSSWFAPSLDGDDTEDDDEEPLPEAVEFDYDQANADAEAEANLRNQTNNVATMDEESGDYDEFISPFIPVAQDSDNLMTEEEEHVYDLYNIQLQKQQKKLRNVVRRQLEEILDETRTLAMMVAEDQAKMNYAMQAQQQQQEGGRRKKIKKGGAMTKYVLFDWSEKIKHQMNLMHVTLSAADESVHNARFFINQLNANSSASEIQSIYVQVNPLWVSANQYMNRIVNMADQLNEFLDLRVNPDEFPNGMTV